MTFIVRGTRGEDATTVVRLRADTAVAKARELASMGWGVFIDCPGDIRNFPDGFDNMLSDFADNSAPPTRQTESDLDGAV
jgi:hypothetical protein